ncbi:MAG TPA: hypothetical protein VK503_05440 [Candidatus Bathyarchaeia archaeon]|nr:hypothetical protein [Candidatus Bathyarchaeia archaeon]
MARKARNVSERVAQSEKSHERKTKPEVTGFKDGLSEPIPNVNSEGGVTELEDLLSITRRDLEMAKATIGELESNISASSLKIHELQNELSKSVPRDDLEAVKAQLELKNANLEEKLSASVPKSEADELRNTITELETKLSRFVPKSEQEAFRENASRLEAMLAETREKLTLTEANRRDLESKLTQSVSRTELETAKVTAEARISELQTQLSESNSEADALREKIAALEPRVTENELDTSIEHVEETDSVEPITETGENLMTPTCPSCNASTLREDMYCGNCGTLLEAHDELQDTNV